MQPYCNQKGFIWVALSTKMLQKTKRPLPNAEGVAIFYAKTVLAMCLQALRPHLREEEYVLDGRGVGHEHCQTVDTHSES